MYSSKYVNKSIFRICSFVAGSHITKRPLRLQGKKIKTHSTLAKI